MKPVSISVRSRRLPRGLLRSLIIVVLTLASWKPVSNASDLAGPGLEIFESKIRPLLASRCYGCHSKAEGKVKAGLELDWKGGWEKGGDSGPAIVAGDPEKSLLIKAVRFTDPSLQMPPKGERLSAQEIEHLSAWIKMGAPDPRNAPLTKSGQQAPSATAHWAFQPLRPPALSSPGGNVKDMNPVDFFVNQKLEESGLRPAEAANKHTLLRRAYFDLIGLPPTPEQSQAFLGDVSANAFEKVVDELLASPHYGERWGRHWLDVARYSDTKGQFRRQRESSVYPYAWTYRDYVIESFNQDKPYPQFIQEQIAADLLPRKDPKALAGLGFLTLGDRFNGNENEIINDRIDVLSKGFLGLTVSCARCHDHRFDPVPTADYYSLHGIL
ncbi:MAG: DUF1549 domain-containing protein, partial [Verrucomicrobia bacterium]|nr:DUF1549 domain-containing protein [Verrucomicrobiota bacterium]